jgi:hypothetical protein
VVGVVVGWPAFIVWYLRRVQLQGRTADESVLSRVGFLFEQYRPEYLYWDVVETVRKLYLVTVVAFFESGTMLQLVLSVIVSSLAFAYHVYSLPFKDRWLNVLQGACLFMIWASLQAGMLMVTTQPSLGAGAALLTALSVANIVMLVSPAVIVVLAVLQVIPAALRARVSVMLGWEAGADADTDAEADKSSIEPVSDAHDGSYSGALGPAADGSGRSPHGEHDVIVLHPAEGTWADDEESVTSSSGATVQVEMVELAMADVTAASAKERADLPAPEPKATMANAGAVDVDVTRTNVRSWLLARGASTDAAAAVQRLMEERDEQREQLLRQLRQQDATIQQLQQPAHDQQRV